jgi:hypothetical protein
MSSAHIPYLLLPDTCSVEGSAATAAISSGNEALLSTLAEVLHSSVTEDIRQKLIGQLLIYFFTYS